MFKANPWAITMSHFPYIDNMFLTTESFMNHMHVFLSKGIEATSKKGIAIS